MLPERDRLFSADILLANAVQWVRGAVYCIPRQQLMHIAVPIAHLPQRMVKSAIRLQVSQKSPFPQFGFAYLLEAGVAQVWFWNESLVFGKTSTPVPEPFLRAIRPLDGWHMVACDSGYEAIWRYSGWLARTQWFSTLPSQDQWSTFVGDSAPRGDSIPLPAISKPTLNAAPPIVIHIDSRAGTKSLGWRWAASLAVACVGALVIAGGVRQYRLMEAMRQVEQKVAEFKKTDLQMTQLRARAQELALRVNGITGMLNAKPVSALLFELLQTGALDPVGGLSLREWEVRGDRVKMVFDVPPAEQFSLTKFLANIQSAPSLSDVRLLNPVDPQTVVLQAVLRSVANSNTVP